MTMASSVKIHNYEYAPGIATYGVDGKTGERGEDGTTLFYTSYSIGDKEGLRKFIQAIKTNRLPVYGNDKEIERKYRNGDMFFDSVGDIYTLTDISFVFGDGAARATSYRKFMKKSGVIKLNDKSSVVTTGQNDRVCLDSNYNGLDINTDGESEYALRVSSAQETGEQHIMRLQTTYGGDVSSHLDFYYDSNLRAYHIESDKPILIDADLKVSDNASGNIDGYSSVQTSDTRDSITGFHNACARCKVAFANETGEHGRTMMYRIDQSKSELGAVQDAFPDEVTVKITYSETKSDAEPTDDGVRVWMCRYRDGERMFYDAFNDSFAGRYITLKTVSFIKNVECFVKWNIV